MVIVAAGKGIRFGYNKSFVNLKKKPLFIWSVEKFIESDLIDSIILVFQKNDIETAENSINQFIKNDFDKIINIVSGGNKRQDSVANALKSIDNSYQKIIIHDAARPFLSFELINNVLDATEYFDGVAPAIPVSDTIKLIENNKILNTIDRSNLVRVQTPQCFKSAPLIDSYNKAKIDNFYSTDDCALLEKYGYNVGIVTGEMTNIKITTQEDFKYARFLKEKGVVNV